MEPSVSEVTDDACCERDEGMNKVHSLLNNSKTSITHHMNRSVRISQLTNKSTPTVTDASHGLHMPESQNDSDRQFVKLVEVS